MKISVIGDGSWGSALSILLLNNGHDVTLWGAFPEYLQEMSRTKVNTKFLPGVTFPAELKFSTEPEDLADSELTVLATPTQFLRPVLQRFKSVFAANPRPLVNVAKGIEKDSWLRISQIVEQEIGAIPYAVLSGPSHAEEVSRNVPTLLTVASLDDALAETVQREFMNSYLRVYTSSDVTGVELGGALKNVMAIAAGIIDGMKLGDNPKAALMTRGIAEMGRLGEALGGRAATFAGLAGIGDLIVTCCSGHSRNRHVGEELGQGRTLTEILQEMGMVVAEGVPTTLGAYTLARESGVEAPIIEQMYGILYENKSALAAIGELMGRSARPEAD